MKASGFLLQPQKRFALPKSSEQCKLKLPHHGHANSALHYSFRVLRGLKSLLKGIIFRKYLVTYIMAGHLPCLCSFESLPAFLPECKFGILYSDLYINKANSSVGGSTVRWLLGCYTALFFPRCWYSKIMWPCFLLVCLQLLCYWEQCANRSEQNWIMEVCLPQKCHCWTSFYIWISMRILVLRITLWVSQAVKGSLAYDTLSSTVINSIEGCGHMADNLNTSF